MQLLPIFFTLINFAFVGTMSQMQQITPEQELLQRQQHLLQQYQHSLQQMPQLVQYKQIFDHLQQIVLQELLLAVPLKRKNPAETQLFLHNNSEEEKRWGSQITEMKGENEPMEHPYILQHFSQDQKNAKSVDKRHQPKDDDGFYKNDDVLSVDETTQTKYLLDKFKKLLQGNEMQQLLPQNADKRQKQQKVVANILEFLKQQNQVDEQQPPPLREVEDLVTQHTDQQQQIAVESQETQNVRRIHNERPQHEGILEKEYHEAQENSYDLHKQQIFQFHQPDQEKLIVNLYSQPDERLWMEMQHPKIKRNEYYQPDAEFILKRRSGYEGGRQQQENVEFQSVVQRLQKILERQSEPKRDEMWQNEHQSPVLQMRPIEKVVALQQLQNHIKNQIRAPEQNNGRTEWNQSERFYQQPTMPNPLNQLNMPGSVNVLDIVESQDLSPHAPLQATMLAQMPMANTQFWNYPNNNAAPITAMMMQTGNNAEQQNQQDFNRPMLSTMLTTPMSNAQFWNYPNNNGAPITAVMQPESNAEPQGSNFGGYPNVPAMNTQQMTDQDCPNGGACMSVSPTATATNNTTEDVKETILSKLTSRFKVTTVSVVIAVIQKLLILEVWENIKASNVAIEEAESFIFAISANMRVLSTSTDHVLFLRRRLEYFPVHFGQHHRVLTQIRQKISRMGSLQYQTTRSIEAIKIDLIGRRKVALTYKQQQLTNGLINIVIFVMNLIQWFPEEESLTEVATLFQGVVTAVFAALPIANAVIFFHLKRFLVAFDEILESISEQELQLESLTAHFHDIVDRVDFAFENPPFLPSFGYPGSGPGSIKNINFSNSGALTGTASVGGFSFGSRGMGMAATMGPPVENKPGDNPPEMENSSPAMESSSPAMESSSPAAESSPPATESSPPAMESSPPEMSSVEPPTEGTLPSVPAAPPSVPTAIDPPAVTVPSGSRIIRKPNTQNANLVNKLTRLKHAHLIIRN